jgi:hypothetical protein
MAAGSININGVPMPINDKAILIVDRHRLRNIIDLILTKHEAHKPEFDKFAKTFWRGDADRTARAIWDFLKKNIQTVTEDSEVQTIKSPAAFIYEGHGDCKHYASFANGVCDSLARQGYPISCSYRFTSDSPGAPVHHVFSVINTEKGERWLDGILSTFDQKNKFYNVKDYPMLYYISGTNAVGLSLRRNKDLHPNKVSNAIKANANKIKNVKLKVSLLTARNSFLALVKINALNLATRLDMALKSAATNARTLKIWRDLGGDVTALVKSVEVGRVKKMIGESEAAYIGGEPVTTASLIALATAVISAFAGVLQMSKKEKEQTAAAAAAGTMEVATGASNQIDGQTSPLPIKGGVSYDNGTATVTVDAIPKLEQGLTKAQRFESLPAVQDPAGTPVKFTDKLSKGFAEIWDNYKAPITVVGLGLATAAGYKYFLSQRKKR